MMRHATMLACALCLPLSGAWAQNAGTSSDTATILRALEDMRGELKALRGEVKATTTRIDRLEKGTPKAAIADPASVPAAAAPRSTKLQGRTVAGWNVELVPYTEERTGDAVGSFPGLTPEFNFNMHTRYMPGQNRYIYHGVSTFHPKEQGRYRFVVQLIPVATSFPGNIWVMSIHNCSAEFIVAGNRVLNGTTELERIPLQKEDAYREQMFFSEPYQMEPKPEPEKGYPVEFRADCWPEAVKTAATFDQFLPGWKKNRFKVLVKGPDDTLPRPFKSEELYFLAQ